MSENNENDLSMLLAVSWYWNQYLENTIMHQDQDAELQEIVSPLMATLAKNAAPLRLKLYVERVVPSYTDNEFQENFRMTRVAFEKLFIIVNQRIGEPTTRKYYSIKRDLLATIWVLANQEAFRSTAERFDMAKSTLIYVFFRTVRIICSLSSEIIKWPSGEEISSYQLAFKRLSGLNGIIGAIDGTYCKIEAPKNDPTAYINRKCFTSITLQAICGPNLKYTDCFAGYPSSVHDIRIFRNSDIYSHVINKTSSHFPTASYIIGDKAYPSLDTCVVPFRQNGRLTREQKSFNYYHAKARQVIERSFALLFGRWRRLKHLKMQCIEMIPFVVLAACVLHNICLEFDDTNIEDYIQETRAEIQDNGDNSTPAFAYGQEENSSEALAFRQELCDELFSRRQYRGADGEE